MPDVSGSSADPTRRGIVDALRDGERSVNQLVAVVSIGQPGVSRQLQISRTPTSWSSEPRAGEAVRPDRFRELSEWVVGYRTIWERRLDTLAAGVMNGECPLVPTTTTA